MKTLFFDFESYWQRGTYTLRTMSPAEYILDPRFEALGCAFKWQGERAFWVDGPDLPGFLAEEVNWQDTFAVSHNALFDACILKWRYNITPAMAGDTMAMAQNWLSHRTNGVSLAKICAYYGFPSKMDTVNKTDGLSFAAIRADKALYMELITYGCDDAAKCEMIFDRIMSESFPAKQLKVIDRVIRMATRPKFVVDQQVLAEHLANTEMQKKALLDQAGLMDADGLMSDMLFAWLLMARDVDVPMKISKRTGQPTYAFAKTDTGLQMLRDHEDPEVQALVEARLGHKTTIEESRTKRFQAIGNLPWPPWERPQSLPVPLYYSGAHTHRLSGAWKMNMQNLGRKSPLRRALKAPEGHVVVSVDAKQIEARLNATIAMLYAKEKFNRYSDLVERFEAGRDVYCDFASIIYSRPIDETDKAERFVGKTGILSLGYGSSWSTFQNMCRIQSDGSIVLSNIAAETVVSTYRKTYPEIPAFWRSGDNMVSHMYQAMPDQWMAWGPVYVGQESIVLPNGNYLRYRNLRRHPDTHDWVYDYGNETRKLYGAKLVENIVQALAFMLIMEADERVAVLTQRQLDLAHQIHDELIYVVPERHAETVKAIAMQEISRRPTWLPELPLAASGAIGDSYGSAK